MQKHVSNLEYKGLNPPFIHDWGFRPYNSWDRQPYLTRNGVDDGYPDTDKLGLKGVSIIKKLDFVRKNFFINGYNSVWTIDHDDGSQFFNDTENFMVWGGCKVRRCFNPCTWLRTSTLSLSGVVWRLVLHQISAKQ